MPPMKTKSSGIQVVDRIAQLLEGIANAREPVSLQQSAADSGLHPSTAFRILAALQQHDLVEKNAGGNYELGRRLLRLAQKVPARNDLREVAKPILNWLRDQTGETENLTVREGDEVIYVERAVPNRMMRVEQIIGSRAPLHVTAVGKLMLAEGGATSCRAYARRTSLPPYTAKTHTRAQQLIEAAKHCHASGFVFVVVEAELGEGSIGEQERTAVGVVV